MTCNPESKVKQAIKKLKVLQPGYWGEYMLSKDPLYKKMNAKTKRDIITNSFKCAKEEYIKYIKSVLSIKSNDYTETFFKEIVFSFFSIPSDKIKLLF